MLPSGIVLACTLTREDARDAIILGQGCGAPDPADPYGCLPAGAVIGTASVRRQSQILFARPGTPPEVLAVLRDAAARALKDPAVSQRLASAGCETWPDSSPAAAATLLKREIERWTPIVAAMNLNPG